LELATYYDAVGETMLPHVGGRPLTLVRWSEKETSRGGIYLRHDRPWGPKELLRVRIDEQKKRGHYLAVQSVEGLVALAQSSILEIHTWNSTAEHIEHPDRIIFDLDPGAGIDWVDIVHAARFVRDRLASIKLQSWVKTTGGRGLHVVVPLVPSASWDECLEFTETLARVLARLYPGDFVAKMGASARKRRIYIDYLRNRRTATSVAAYSTRARRGTPVSVPVSWDELDGVRPEELTIRTVPDLLRRRREPWTGYWRARQVLPRLR
jgi:bifunctional non-homologous end joining protein LigD